MLRFFSSFLLQTAKLKCHEIYIFAQTAKFVILPKLRNKNAILAKTSEIFHAIYFFSIQNLTLKLGMYTGTS